MDLQYDSSLSVTDYNHLREAVGWGRLPEEQAQIGLNRSDYVVRAGDGDRTVGMARVLSDGGCVAFILDVVVLPEYQRQGIGKTMLRMVMEYLQEELQHRGVIYVGLMAAKGKEEFYQQFGFEQRPNDRLGAGMTQWLRSETV